MLSEAKQTLLKNTVFLYLLRFSTMFFGFLTMPYLTRVLTPEHYGRLSLATALMYYFYLILDFGFILSATESASRAREDKAELSHILTAVYLAKVLLSFASLAALLLLCNFSAKYRGDFLLYAAYLLAAVAEGFLPDFLYRGLEDMLPITLRSLTMKGLATLLTFVLVRGPEDILRLPLLQATVMTLAVLVSLSDLRRRHAVRLTRISAADFRRHFRASQGFFLSRIASTLYGSFNTLLLGEISPATAPVSYYGTAEKLISTGKSALAPVADSLYPYMVARRDFRLIRRTLLFLMPPIVLGCSLVFIWAEPFCVWLFGPAYGGAGPVLRAMLPGAVFVLPDYLLGFPSLAALGRAQEANRSIYFACLLHLPLLLIVYLMGALNTVGLAALLSLATINETLYRAVVIWRARAEWQEPQVLKSEES